MTLPEARLAELDRINRERSLTDQEQREALLRAKQVRRNIRRRALYWLDPTYRQRRIDTNGRVRA